jgi:hypothetical protein
MRSRPAKPPPPPLARPDQPLPSPGDAHVGQPPLLLDLLRLADGAEVGEHALLQAEQEHDRELQALGGVQRHQRDLGVVLAELVGVGHQRDLLEEGVDRLVL